MKLFYKKISILLFLILSPVVVAQEIQIITHEMTKYEPVGTFEIILDFEVVNISNMEQIVFEIRTINNLPPGWISSLCFGQLCFDPAMDTIMTAPPFPVPPLQPLDTLRTSLHVFTDQSTIATAYVQIEVGTMSNPNNKYVLDFIATTDPSLGVKENNLVNNFSLSQNYPNPFNPSTKITYSINEPGLVKLEVYNLLGVEIATLVNEQKSSGSYVVDFNAANLSSGIYFYSLSVNNFTQTRKMILEK